MSEENQEIKIVLQAPKKVVRKARIQAEKQDGPQFQREEGGMDYNIWYHSYIGHKRDRFGVELEPAKTRCSISKDSGWSIGCQQKDPYFCLYFARGCCTQGPECKFMHRIPTKTDDARVPVTKDVFGRDKFASDKDDMSGIGSFNRESKTLYVTNLKNLTDEDLAEIVTRHFKEWGKLEFVKVYPERCYAFVKYELRLCAEFAKVAMTSQSLDNGEVLNIKWATEDQDPMSVARDLIDKRQKLIHNMKEQDVDIKQVGFNYPKGYKVVDPKIEGAKGQLTDSTDALKECEKQDLNHTHYIHQTLKNAKLMERAEREQEKIWNDQKEKLKSNVAEPYPNTDAQFSNQFQKQLGSNQTTTTQEKTTKLPHQQDFYSSYDPAIYQTYLESQKK